MKLYFMQGACSLATRIILEELQVPYVAEKVNPHEGQTESGGDYTKINPRGYVPALELDDGTVITENPAVLQYLADAHPEAGLAPVVSLVERARLRQWLNFTSSELHKAFGPFFATPAPHGAAADQAHEKLARRLGDVERELSDGRSFLLGQDFSVADAYLFVVLSWCGFVGVDLSRWPACAAFSARCAERPAVQRALIKEGLVAEDASA